MPRTSTNLIHLGETLTHLRMVEEDKIWSKFSNDKVDIGETLMQVIRTLDKNFTLEKRMRAISIGSSNEPQFRILEAAFRGGLYLLDIDKQALEIVKERIKRQNTTHVHLLNDDYNKIFLDEKKTRNFLKTQMGGKKAELVTLQHSMYYSPAVNWYSLIRNLYSEIMAPRGVLYSVLMSSKSDDRRTTTWLYNHFAGKFCGHHNNQDLLQFKHLLAKDSYFKNAQLISSTHRVEFFTEDFEQFMAVIWMILLYPDVHPYTLAERHEITEYIYKNFFLKKIPIIQSQDHFMIYRGVKTRGNA